MILLSHALLVIPLITGQDPAPWPLPPQHPESEVVTWEQIDEVALELPTDARLILRSQRFLSDGSFILKLGWETSVSHFGVDGAWLRNWHPPQDHGDWRRVTYGQFIGDDFQSLWFLPSRSSTLPQDDMAYRLWRDGESGDPEFQQLPFRRIIRAGDGYWAAKGKHVLRLSGSFETLGPVVDPEGEPMTFRAIQQLHVDSSGQLAVLDGSDRLYTCIGKGSPAKPFRIELISPEGRLERTVELPAPLRQGDLGFDFEGQQLLFTRTSSINTRESAREMYAMNLETLAWNRVVLPGSPHVSFRRGSARLINNGQVLKVFDMKNGHVATYRRPAR